MLLQEQIAEIIDSQNKNFDKKQLGIVRSSLSNLPNTNAFALIVTGIRRCGKSTLLYQLKQKYYPNSLFINFEDPRFSDFENSDFNRLRKEISSREIGTLFFDEIQVLKNWEAFVRQQLDNGYHIFVTGSNASMLSRELGSKLTGRHLSFELFPFSYTEYLAFSKHKPNKKSLLDYIEKGGFPEYLKTGIGVVLNNLLEDIILRDIAVRYAVRDVSTLRQLVIYLISNIGKPVSATSLKSNFNVKSTSTLLEYFSYLENSYLVQFLPMFSHSLRAQARNPKKCYVIDLGLFTENSIVFSDENGRRLENLIYLHLRRKYNQIYYHKEKKECDFLVFEKNRIKEIVQVCYLLNDENMDREIDGLLEAMDFHNLKEGKLVTISSKDELVVDGKKIYIIPAWEYVE